MTAGQITAAEAEETEQRWTVAAQERRTAAHERTARLTATRSERAEAEARHAALLATRDRVATHLSELATELEQQVALQGELFAGARDLDGALAESRSRLDRRRGQRSAILDALARFEGELLRQREALAAAASRREALEELISRRDGVSPGAVALVGSELPGIEGLLVDDLRAPADLAEAVESALGATTQAVLVASRAHGLAALQHLRDVKGGRVLLAPRDAMRPRQGAAPGRRLLDELEVRGHRDVMEALLGHVRLVDDRTALETCSPDGVTVWVTPEGDLLDECGVLRGGTAGEEGGLVSRRAERDALDDRCDQLRVRIEQLEAERKGQLDAQLAVEQQLAQAETAVRRLETDRDRNRERERQSVERTAGPAAGTNPARRRTCGYRGRPDPGLGNPWTRRRPGNRNWSRR